jgi:hypothetical protein
VTDQPYSDNPPEEITHLLRQRTEARAARDWARADALKAEIEAAGWRVMDRGPRSRIQKAAPSSVEVAGELRYGAASAVPSALGAPATAGWTVALLASEEPARLSRLLAGLRAHAPAGTQVVIVANDPSDAQAEALFGDAAGSADTAPIGGASPEILRTSTRLGYGAALNIALRRCEGRFVLLADGSAAPTGDAFTPLAAALEDPDVAAAGGYGVSLPEAGRLLPAAFEPAGGGDVTALLGAWLAFRRDDLAALGPLDEHFITPAWMDVWWTLRLRAGGESDGVENVEAESDPESEGEAEQVAVEYGMPDLPAPRRALALELPLEREDSVWPPERTRLNRRNMYRVLDDFGWRVDLTGDVRPD